MYCSMCGRRMPGRYFLRRHTVIINEETGVGGIKWCDFCTIKHEMREPRIKEGYYDKESYNIAIGMLNRGKGLGSKMKVFKMFEEEKI